MHLVLDCISLQSLKPDEEEGRTELIEEIELGKQDE
jgi:hypothetical protein